MAFIKKHQIQQLKFTVIAFTILNFTFTQKQLNWPILIYFLDKENLASNFISTSKFQLIQLKLLLLLIKKQVPAKSLN